MKLFVGRHLDLDHATFETSDNKQHIPARDLSLHMKLDYFEDEDVSCFFHYYSTGIIIILFFVIDLIFCNSSLKGLNKKTFYNL